MSRSLVAVLALAGIGGAASARPEYALETDKALSVPIAGSAYTTLVDPSYSTSLRFAAAFPVASDVSVGPSVEIDGLPLNSSETAFNAGDANMPRHRNASLGRVRGLAGVKLSLKSRYLEMWVGLQLGADAILGKVTQEGLPTRHVSSTAFGFVPEVGFLVPISRAFIGLRLTTPVAFDHHIAPLTATDPMKTQPTTPRGNTVDLAPGVVLGVRL